MNSIEQFLEAGGDHISEPLEQLRFFCSIAMDGEDWLEVEQFFKATEEQIAELVELLQSFVTHGYSKHRAKEAITKYKGE